ncbi:hypothetical protein, variant [Capsaspora owczarzaki ATCC 30864]|uniref:Amino acid transporter transmembrane domain-containing protein n=1 Tax=Capsaspora owczarzaki (strain ATCC 30864) TaxID=595528 RepID=A0A0D2WJ21_CAPO3|nr:hypothetical protein, variant [Capsaspora owczarzaki ATCC 30864]
MMHCAALNSGSEGWSSSSSRPSINNAASHCISRSERPSSSLMKLSMAEARGQSASVSTQFKLWNNFTGAGVGWQRLKKSQALSDLCYYFFFSDLEGAGLLLQLPSVELGQYCTCLVSFFFFSNARIPANLGAIASSFGLQLLVECARRTGQVNASYFTVAKHTYPKASKLIDLAVALKCYGVAISYLIVVGDLLVAAMLSLFDVSSDSVVADRRFWIGMAMLIELPLSIQKHLNSLRWASVAALATVIYLTGLVCGNYFASGVDASADAFELEYWRSDVDVITALPIIVFAFTCHQNIFTIYGELRNPTAERIHKVINLAISSCLFIYFTVGICGYLTFRLITRSNIILNYTRDELQIWANICRLAVAVLALFSYPLQVHPCRTSIENLLFASSPLHNADRRRVIETLVLCLTTFLIAFFVSDLDIVLGFVGATGSTTLCYLLPGLFYLKLEANASKWHWRRIGALILAVVGVIMIFVANTVTIMKAVDPDSLPNEPAIPNYSTSSSFEASTSFTPATSTIDVSSTIFGSTATSSSTTSTILSSGTPSALDTSTVLSSATPSALDTSTVLSSGTPSVTLDSSATLDVSTTATDLLTSSALGTDTSALASESATSVIDTLLSIFTSTDAPQSTA